MTVMVTEEFELKHGEHLIKDAASKHVAIVVFGQSFARSIKDKKKAALYQAPL